MVKRGNKKYRIVAMKSLQKVKSWVDKGNPNCVHILYFLEAEKASCEGAVDKARKFYDKSIASAARNGFRSDRALANERCAHMYQQIDDEFWSNEYFHRAYDEYLEFEAHAKADQLRKIISSLRPSVSISAIVEEAPTLPDKKAPFPITDVPHSVTVLTPSPLVGARSDSEV
jgi:hypothetical protein